MLKFASRRVSAAVAVLTVGFFAYVAHAAISVSTSPYSQNFDGMGIPATGTTSSTLPTDFRVDNPATVRTVGSFSVASSTVGRAGGANLSTSASNGIYNFGSGTAALGGSDRAVGFLSSGTATASGNLYAQLVNNTGASLTGLRISYNVEKYRQGSNAAGFRVQMFYSTDGSTWTSAGANFTTSFGADANNNGFSTAPGATASVTNQTLTTAITNGQNFYLAWNYSVASGSTTTNAQALAIDDISIVGIPSTPITSPTVAGSAAPTTVSTPGGQVVLTANVTPGTNPDSTGLTVTADLTSIGGSATQSFAANGNTFTFTASVPGSVSNGVKSIPVTVTDAQSRSGNASMSVDVEFLTSPTATGSANPATVGPGDPTTLSVTVVPGTNPASSGIAVTADLSSIGGAATQSFSGSGNTFTFAATVDQFTGNGTKTLPVSVTDLQGRSATASITVTVAAHVQTGRLVISQVYGGGGNSGSTYTNDFIEIFNPGSAAVSLNGWSVQATSASSTSWTTNGLPTPLSGTINPGQYYLVQESQGTGGTTPLPAADATGLITMSGTNAKVALVAGTGQLSGLCPTGGTVIDMVGYGSASCFETAATPTLSNLTAAQRKGNGCIDTDNNANDFLIGGPIPRNSASPFNGCGGDPSQPSGVGLATPSALEPASNVLLTVQVAPATVPASTGLAVVADLTAIGGSSTQQFYDDGTHGDVTAGDNKFSFLATVGPFITTGAKSIVARITDGQARSATAPITVTISSPTCGVERWSVKTGTDPDAPSVNVLSPFKTTIFNLGALAAPADPPGPPLNSRVSPTEDTVYVINATMTLFKKETDVDYHIVLQDATTHTMIAEIPSPACVGTSSPFAAAVSAARVKFDGRFSATTSFQSVTVPVQITGVGFFDFIRGQTGVAPNGVELHPVLGINFTANSLTTLLSSGTPSQYGQPVAIAATVTNT
jgi:hypothetical protein